MPIDIEEVPESPNTGFMPKEVYNPTDENFIHFWDGKPHMIPAGQSASFPEFIARHLAKHLAQKIVTKKWEIKIKKEAVGQITPDTAKAIPLVEVQTMMEALLAGRNAFEAMEGANVQPNVVAEPAAEVKQEQKPEVKVEEPKIEPNPLKCSKCEFVAKNKNGLRLHSTKHK